MEDSDYDLLKAWMETVPSDGVSFIASRAALRVLPMTFRDFLARQLEPQLSLLVARATICAWVYSTKPKKVMIQTAVEAQSAIRAFTGDKLPNYGVKSAYLALSSIIDDTTATENALQSIATSSQDLFHGVYDQSESLAHEATYADVSAGSAAWRDATIWPKKEDKLWKLGPPSFSESATKWEYVLALWNEFLGSENGRSQTWSFWIEWYQGFLDGKPMDWELQKRVALIPNDVWEAGPEAVARAIEEIRNKWEANQTVSKEPQPETVDVQSITTLFDRAALINSGMANLSQTLSMRLDLFDRMVRPNEAIPFIETCRRLPEIADSIREIIGGGKTADGAELMLAQEVGRLRAEVENLREQLKVAHLEIDELRKKPWYRRASVVTPTTVIGAVVGAVWMLSGDDKSLEDRWNKLAIDLEFSVSKIWGREDTIIDKPLRFELPDIDIEDV